MPSPTLASARSHYRRQSRIAAVAVAAVRAIFHREPRQVTKVAAAYQYVAAKTAVETVALWADRDHPIAIPSAFAGYSSEGLPLEDALAPLVADLMKQAERMAEVEMYRLDRAIQSAVADAGRSASQVEMVMTPEWTNYVRMLTPPSCARCAILAGRIYRDLDAFARHPGCDCVMVPVTDWQDAHDKGLVSSFAAQFEAGDVRGLSKADARAISEGADPGQVINASRGVTVPGRLTAAVTVNDLKSTTAGAPRGFVRLRPEAIYRIARNRAEVQQLLMRHGYIGELNPAALIEAPDVAQAPKKTPHRPAQNNLSAGDLLAGLDAAYEAAKKRRT